LTIVSGGPMVVGDVVSQIDDIAGGGGFADFRPAVGVEVMILSVGMELNDPAGNFNLVDGVANNATVANGDWRSLGTMKTGVTNDIWFRMHNTAVPLSNMGFSGIQIA